MPQIRADVPKMNLTQLLPIRHGEQEDLPTEFRITGSGKSAISLILNYLRTNDFLKDKNSTILVNPWMGQWVYHTISNFGRPIYNPKEDSRVVYLYHQYGYEQNMSAILDYISNTNKLIIEDDAHGLKFENDIQIIGTKYSEYSFTSPSKFVPSPPIGIVRSSNLDFLNFVEMEQKVLKKKYVYKNAISKYRFEKMQRDSKKRDQISQINFGKLYSSYPYIHNATQAATGALSQLRTEWNIRTSRELSVYSTLGHEFLPLITNNDKNKAHLKLPVFLSERQQEKLFAIDQGWRKSKFSFDKNRNILDSRYVDAICLPLGSHVSNQIFEQSVNQILEVICGN